MTVPPSANVDRNRLKWLREREDETFRSQRPRSASLRARASQHMPGGVPTSWMAGLYRTPPIYIDRGEGPRFYDVDGHGYLDFNVCDLSMTMGYGPRPIVAAVAGQIARGAHFLLPTDDAIEVAELLAIRTRVPHWQFTLSASGANTEVIRTARHLTGRSKLVVFAGHYHGHLDDTLVVLQDGKPRTKPGVPPAAAANTEIVPFNDVARLEAALARQDVALVLTEPALTNCNLVLPQPGFLAQVRELTKRYGTLLCFDEAHTFQFAYGGLVGAWQLDTDFIVLGKGLGSGIGFGLYGMSSEIAADFAKHSDSDVGPDGIATGGTLYGSAIALATARAALIEVLTPEAYERVVGLGNRLADGLDHVFAKHGLPWCAFRLGPRSGYCLERSLPANYSEASRSLDVELIDTRRVYMANRGIWDAIASAGPQASFVHTPQDIDEYVRVAGRFIAEIVGA